MLRPYKTLVASSNLLDHFDAIALMTKRVLTTAYRKAFILLDSRITLVSEYRFPLRRVRGHVCL